MIANKILNVFAVIVFSFAAYCMFVLLPMKLYTDSDCLKKGYPQYAVSIWLECYCISDDGQTVVRSDK